jgi:hypothetical protein
MVLPPWKAWVMKQTTASLIAIADNPENLPGISLGFEAEQREEIYQACCRIRDAFRGE